MLSKKFLKYFNTESNASKYFSTEIWKQIKPLFSDCYGMGRKLVGLKDADGNKIEIKGFPFTFDGETYATKELFEQAMAELYGAGYSAHLVDCCHLMFIWNRGLTEVQDDIVEANTSGRIIVSNSGLYSNIGDYDAYFNQFGIVSNSTYSQSNDTYTFDFQPGTIISTPGFLDGTIGTFVDNDNLILSYQDAFNNYGGIATIGDNINFLGSNFTNSTGNNTFGNGCIFDSTGGNFDNSIGNNTFGVNCIGMKFAASSGNNVFGDGCEFSYAAFQNSTGNNTFGNGSVFDDESFEACSGINSFENFSTKNPQGIMGNSATGIFRFYGMIGVTNGFDDVFSSNLSSLTIEALASHAISNAGAPEGDLRAAILNGATVSYIL